MLIRIHYKRMRCTGAGTLLTLIRTQTGRLWRTLSVDNGTNLQPATETAFTSSDSPAMLLTLRSLPLSLPPTLSGSLFRVCVCARACVCVCVCV